MTDFLANDNPRILEAAIDAITAMPDEPRARAIAALAERRVSALLQDEDALDGTRIYVLELSIIDEDGAHPFARLDAARFGLDP